MGSAAEQGRLWSEKAANWANLQEPQHIPLFRAMLDTAHVGAGTRLLDAGCGGGGASVLAAGRGAQVSGLDAAEGMIAIARERVPAGDFRVGDLEALPFEDNSFAAVIAPNSVQFTKNRVNALRELGRVCTPEGRIVVALFGAPEQVTFHAIFAAMAKAMPSPPNGDGPMQLSVPGMLEGLIEQAGLTIVGGGEVDCPFHYPDFDTFWQASSSAGPFQNMARTVGAEKLQVAMREAIEPFRNDGTGYRIGPNIFRYVVATP